ncbi:hypothetical protein ABZ770_12495 [Streptomyces sp. NPDC006654]
MRIVLEDGDEDAIGGSHREQVEDDRGDRDRQRAERRQHHEEDEDDQ